MEKAAAKNTQVSSFLSGLCFTREIWVREVMVELAECQFEYVSAELLAELVAYARRLLGTKLVEDMIGEAKRVCSSSPNGKLSDIGRWKACQVSGILVENDRPPVDLTPAARSAAADRIPSHCFRTTRASPWARARSTLCRKTPAVGRA